MRSTSLGVVRAKIQEYFFFKLTYVNIKIQLVCSLKLW